jgi:hypothetical protein
LVIRKVIVHDEQDEGIGEINLLVKVRANDQRCPRLIYDSACGRLLVIADIPEFAAGSGDIIGFDRVVPSTDDLVADPRIRPELGIPLRASEWAGFSIVGTESDLVLDDEMGILDADFVEANGAYRLGVFTERSIGACPHRGVGAFCSKDSEGAFSVEYEIRRIPLPDLRPTIRLVDAGGQQSYCGVVENVGERPSGPFQLTVRADEARLRTVTLPALEVHETTEHCVLGSEIPAGYLLTFSVDDDWTIAEMNEHNNQYQWRVSPQTSVGAPQPALSQGQTSSPTPTASPVLADLTVSSIRVNGQVPDGKDDCKDGKNAATVVVKNGGTANAGSFVLRLAVDGDPAIDNAMPGLEAGAEREVRFDDVRLKKGEHKLQITADAKGAVAEAAESNNTVTIAARCNDAN